MAPHYGYYEDSTHQQRSNWSYVDEGRIEPPPQLQHLSTYYSPSYDESASNISSYHGSSLPPIQRTKITRTEAVVRDVQQPYSKSRRQQVDEFATNLREEAMKIIAQRKLMDTGHGVQGDHYTDGEVDHLDHVVRGDGVGWKTGLKDERVEGDWRSPKVNGQDDPYHNRSGLGWYRGGVKEEQNKGKQRSLKGNHQEEYYGGGSGSYYPPPRGQSGVIADQSIPRNSYPPVALLLRDEAGGNQISPHTRQQGYNGYGGIPYRQDQHTSAIANRNNMTTNSTPQQYYRDHDRYSKPNEEKFPRTSTNVNRQLHYDRSYGQYQQEVDDYDELNSKWRRKPLEEERQQQQRSLGWNRKEDPANVYGSHNHPYSGLDDENSSISWWKNNPRIEEDEEFILGGNHGFYKDRGVTGHVNGGGSVSIPCAASGYSDVLFYRETGTAWTAGWVMSN